MVVVVGATVQAGMVDEGAVVEDVDAVDVVVFFRMQLQPLDTWEIRVKLEIGTLRWGLWVSDDP